MNNRYYRNGKTSTRRTSVAEQSHLVAVHEAGHIIACCLLDLPITSAAIQSDGIIGFVDVQIPNKRGKFSLKKWQETLLKALVLSYAGAAAEYVVFGKLDEVSCDDDYIAAEKYAAMYIATHRNGNDGIAAGDILLQAGIAAQKLIEEHRGFLDYAVQNLQENGKFTSVQLAMMRAISPFWNTFK